ncbi:MAG: hypothetical protein JXQ29_08390 [Planctomycetes bacterium]|nr:hypothetical protein [Planctomycetota bacterium]
MRILIVLVVLAALVLPGCALGMVKATEIQPAVDLIVEDYLLLKTAQPDEIDPLKGKKMALAIELRATIKVAAEQ